MFRVYNPAGITDSLQLLVLDNATGNILDTVSYKNRIGMALLENGSIGTSVNFNDADELFKGRDLKAMSFIFFNPHNGKKTLCETWTGIFEQ